MQSVPAAVTAQLCGIPPRTDPGPQTKSQIETAGVHPLPEMTDVIPGTAHAHENVTTEGENGAGLEIAATNETEIGIGREASAGSAIMNDVVRQNFDL